MTESQYRYFPLSLDDAKNIGLVQKKDDAYFFEGMIVRVLSEGLSVVNGAKNFDEPGSPEEDIVDSLIYMWRGTHYFLKKGLNDLEIEKMLPIARTS